jgi:hypothetical protein
VVASLALVCREAELSSELRDVGETVMVHNPPSCSRTNSFLVARLAVYCHKPEIGAELGRRTATCGPVLFFVSARTNKRHHHHRGKPPGSRSGRRETVISPLPIGAPNKVRGRSASIRVRAEGRQAFPKLDPRTLLNQRR